MQVLNNSNALNHPPGNQINVTTSRGLEKQLLSPVQVSNVLEMFLTPHENRLNFTDSRGVKKILEVNLYQN